MTGDGSWLDARVSDLPQDENGVRLVDELTDALVGVAESLCPYAGVLMESVVVDLNWTGEECLMTQRAIEVARSADDTVLYYDGYSQLYGLDKIQAKRRWSSLLSLEQLRSGQGRSNLRILFDFPSSVHKMTSRDLITGIKALRQRVQEVASAGPPALEELRRLMSE